MVLGVDPDEQYTQSIIDLETDDMLLLYTDGLPDAMNFQRAALRPAAADRRVRAGRRDGRGSGAEHPVGSCGSSSGLTKRTDDVTMMVVKVK